MVKTENYLLESVEDPTLSLKERASYAEKLAKMGDSRVQTLQPQMIDISGGKFIMGSTKQEIESAIKEYSHIFEESRMDEVKDWFNKEFPAHPTTLETFRMSKYLITNQNFKEFQLDTGQNNLVSFSISQSNHPVKDITIVQAQAYCTWLSQKTNRKFRLPTEAEWEWTAISCTSNFRYPWGNKFDVSVVNSTESNINETTAVGLFPEGFSRQGIADLAGNVEEWTDTIYSPYPNGKLIKDKIFHFGNGKYYILRGGCYALHGDLCLSKRRHGFNPNYTITGFRIAETIKL